MLHLNFPSTALTSRWAVATCDNLPIKTLFTVRWLSKWLIKKEINLRHLEKKKKNETAELTAAPSSAEVLELCQQQRGSWEIKEVFSGTVKVCKVHSDTFPQHQPFMSPLACLPSYLQLNRIVYDNKINKSIG